MRLLYRQLGLNDNIFRPKKLSEPEKKKVREENVPSELFSGCRSRDKIFSSEHLGAREKKVPNKQFSSYISRDKILWSVHLGARGKKISEQTAR